MALMTTSFHVDAQNILRARLTQRGPGEKCDGNHVTQREERLREILSMKLLSTFLCNLNNLQVSGRVHFLDNCLTELELMPGAAPSSLASCLACTESTLSETVTLSSSGR